MADFTLMVDNKVFPLQSVTGNWTESSAILLSSGYHNITIMFPYLQLPELLAISTGNLEQVIEQPPQYSVANSGNSEYNINLQNTTKPVFIMLSEAYSGGWNAYANSQQLTHFYAYSFLNGYYMNNSGSIAISIRYNGQGESCHSLVRGIHYFFTLLLYGIADVYFEKRSIRKRLVPFNDRKSFLVYTNRMRNKNLLAQTNLTKLITYRGFNFKHGSFDHNS